MAILGKQTAIVSLEFVYLYTMLKQNLHLKLLHKLSPQQIQLMKLIQLPTQAFEQRLKQEIEENPALDIERESDRSEDEMLQNEYDENDSETIEAEDINIDEYLSDDDIPDYRLQSNNYSVDDDEYQVPYAAGGKFSSVIKKSIKHLQIK